MMRRHYRVVPLFYALLPLVTVWLFPLSTGAISPSGRSRRAPFAAHGCTQVDVQWLVHNNVSLDQY